MGLLIVLVVGTILGWLVAKGRRSAGSGVALNIILGNLGALFGAFFLGTAIGGGNLLDAIIDPRTALVAVVGAVVLLGGVHLLRARFSRVDEAEEDEEGELADEEEWSPTRR